MFWNWKSYFKVEFLEVTTVVKTGAYARLKVGYKLGCTPVI